MNDIYFKDVSCDTKHISNGKKKKKSVPKTYCLFLLRTLKACIMFLETLSLCKWKIMVRNAPSNYTKKSYKTFTRLNASLPYQQY